MPTSVMLPGKITDVKLQPLKAFSPIFVTVAGRLAITSGAVSAVQPPKPVTVVNTLLAGHVTEARLVQPSKALPPMYTIPSGLIQRKPIQIGHDVCPWGVSGRNERAVRILQQAVVIRPR